MPSWKVNRVASITNQPAWTVGGLGPTIGKGPFASNAIQINANGQGPFRFRTFCTNQLGNIGGGLRNSMFSSSSDGTNGCRDQPCVNPPYCASVGKNLANAPLVYYGPFTLTPSGGSGVSVYLYSIGVNQFLSQRNWESNIGTPPLYPNSFTEVLFSVYWNMGSGPPPMWPPFNFAAGPPSAPPWTWWAGLPKDTDEQQAYSNVWSLTNEPLATWQGYLTGISNPITQLWIIANAADSSVNKALIFTRSTNNPLTDYNNIPQSITGGASLTS